MIKHLRDLNDDYATERDSALKEVFLEVLPEEKFMKFMELKGKLGSQHKFPRVMKGKMLEDWNRFLGNGNILIPVLIMSYSLHHILFHWPTGK